MRSLSATAANALQLLIDNLVFLIDRHIARRAWTGCAGAAGSRSGRTRRHRRSRRTGGAGAVGSRRRLRDNLSRIAGAAWIIDGIILAAGIGGTRGHAADCRRSRSRGSRRRRACRAAGTSRWSAGTSATAGSATTTLRERAYGASKNCDCNDRCGHRYSGHKEISLWDSTTSHVAGSAPERFRWIAIEATREAAEACAS